MEFTFALLFLQGLLSFFTPCVLPLIPAYLAAISGTAAGAAARGDKRSTLVGTLCFTAGFTAVFVALGASATLIGNFLLRHMSFMRYISGALIILFGITCMEVIPLRFLQRELRLGFPQKLGGPLGALLMGMAFSFGWTPCIGPVLAGVLLALSGSGANVISGMALLAAYSLGLALPFIIAALFADKLLPKLKALGRHALTIRRAGGALLVLMGILVMTNSLAVFAAL